nr:hypothetical protein [Chroococcidiopsis sp. CCMEE 29]
MVEFVADAVQLSVGRTLQVVGIYRCPVNAYPLVCSIAPPAEQPEYYGQKRNLVQTKAKFPEYTNIYSDVLQDCIGRVKKTFNRY